MGLIGDESFNITNRTDDSLKGKNSTPLSVQSVVLDKILDDPQTQEVVVPWKYVFLFQ